MQQVGKLVAPSPSPLRASCRNLCATLRWGALVRCARDVAATITATTIQKSANVRENTYTCICVHMYIDIYKCKLYVQMRARMRHLKRNASLRCGRESRQPCVSVRECSIAGATCLYIYIYIYLYLYYIEACASRRPLLCSVCQSIRASEVEVCHLGGAGVCR